MVVCGTRERLLPVSFIGTALACKMAHLLRSDITWDITKLSWNLTNETIVELYIETIMELDDYDDLYRFLTGDGRWRYTRTSAFSLVYRYRSCLQGGASPAESQMTNASLMVHVPQSRMDITMTIHMISLKLYVQNLHHIP